MVRCRTCDTVYEEGQPHHCHEGQQAPEHPTPLTEAQKKAIREAGGEVEKD